MRTTLILASLCCLSIGASAMPVTWYVDLTFTDGGSANGSFVFNADAGTACSGGTSPCGQFSSVDIVTTAGLSLPGATYTFVCGQDVPTCTGVSPDSTEAMFLTSNAADQTGLPALALFFTAAGPLPPAGLTDAGGTIDMSNTTAGAAQEALCSGASCATPGTPNRSADAGFVTTTPEPSTALLLGGAIALLGLATFVKRGFAHSA